LRYPRRNRDYQLSQMILALVYPILLGLDRLETAALNSEQEELTVLAEGGSFHWVARAV